MGAPSDGSVWTLGRAYLPESDTEFNQEARLASQCLLQFAVVSPRMIRRRATLQVVKEKLGFLLPLRLGRFRERRKPHVASAKRATEWLRENCISLLHT